MLNNTHHHHRHIWKWHVENEAANGDVDELFMHNSLCETNLPWNTNIDCQFLLLLHRKKSFFIRYFSLCCVIWLRSEVSAGVWLDRGKRKSESGNIIKFYGFAKFSSFCFSTQPKQSEWEKKLDTLWETACLTFLLSSFFPLTVRFSVVAFFSAFALLSFSFSVFIDIFQSLTDNRCSK